MTSRGEGKLSQYPIATFQLYLPSVQTENTIQVSRRIMARHKIKGTTLRSRFIKKTPNPTVNVIICKTNAATRAYETGRNE